MKPAAGATTTPRKAARSSQVKKRPEVPTPKNKAVVSSQKILKSQVLKTQPPKKLVKKVEEKKDEEQNDFVVLSD